MSSELLDAPVSAQTYVGDRSNDVYARLLKERIVFLGTQVDDTVGQPHLRPAPPAAERGRRARRLPLHQLARRLGDRGHGHLRHHAVRQLRRRHDLHGPGRLDGPVPALRGHAGQALRPAPLPDPHAPAVGPDAGRGRRHRHPRRADHLHQADHGRAHRLPHRPDGRADRGRLRPRPLVHRRGGARTTASSTT